jgi:hypothetical protein
LAYRACSLGKKTRLKVSFVDLLLEKKYCWMADKFGR